MRPAEPKTNKPCDICGDSGFADFITVCSQCNEAREHIYCMEAFLDRVPGIWFCKKCRLCNDPVTPRQKVNDCRHTTSCDISDTQVRRSLLESTVKGIIPRNFQVRKSIPAKSSKEDTMTQNGYDGLLARTPAQVCKDVLFKASNVKKTECMPMEISPPSKPMTNKLSRGCSFRTSEVSKVKFIPAEEAKLLASGEMLKPSSLRLSSGCSASRPSPRKAMLSPVQKRTISLKDHLQKGISSSNSVISQPTALHGMHLENVSFQPPSVKPQKPMHVEAKSRVECKPTDSERWTDAKSSSRMQSGPAISNLLINVKQEEDDACGLLPVVALAQVSPRKLSSLLQEKLPNHPLPDALWKGNFEIFDAAHCCVFCDGIQAHRPIIVSSKACEVSKWMPTVLQFKLQHRCDIWPRIFLKDCPAANDIALYFFSEDCDSSKVKYIHLVELMEQHDWALTACIDGVELLIFTSKQLPVESQRLNMQIYLWGVFIRRKYSTTSRPWAPSLPPPAPMWDLRDPVPGHEYVTQSQVSISNAGAEDFDMDIDMIGGKGVGRVDMPVPRLLDSKNAVVSAGHLNGRGPSSDRNGLVAGSSMIKQEFPISSSTSIEQDGLSFPSAPPGFSKPIISAASEEKPSAMFGIKKPRPVRCTDVPSCFITPSNMKDGNCLSDCSNYKDRSAVRSSEVQGSTNFTIPRVPPGFTKHTASSDEHQPSQAAFEKQRVLPWSTALRRPRSRRVTRRVKYLYSRGFFGAPLVKNHALQSSRDAVESHIVPVTTNPRNTQKDQQLPKASDYREIKPVSGSTEVRRPSEHIIPAVPPGFTKPVNLSDEHRLSQDAIREGKDVMVEIKVQGKPARRVSGSPGPFDAKDDLHMPGALASRDEKHTLYSSDIQSLSQPTIPRVPPGFTKLINPNDESPSSRADIKTRKDITGSSEIQNPASSRDTEMVEAASFGELLGSWIHKRSAIENVEDDQKPQVDPLTTTGLSLNLFPEATKAEMFGDHSPCEPTQKQLLNDNKDILSLSLSRPHYLKDGNNWISESLKERLKQEGGIEELQLRL